MQDLSIAQKYLICALGGKRLITGFSQEKSVCFMAAALLELQLGEGIGFDRKRVFILGDLPTELDYLKPLYDYIAANGSLKIEKLVGAYHYALTNKRCNALIAAVGNALVAMDAAEALPSSRPGGKTRYFPKKEVLQNILDAFRAEFSAGGEITAEGAVLAFLLIKSKLLKVYFSPAERKEIKAKLKEITDSEECTVVTEIIEFFDELISVITVYTSAFS